MAFYVHVIGSNRRAKKSLIQKSVKQADEQIAIELATWLLIIELNGLLLI